MRRQRKNVFRRLLSALFVLVSFASSGPAQQPMPPEQQADIALMPATKAYAEGNFPIASQRYTEVIQKFPNTKAAQASRLGLGLILIHSPEQDFTKAIENLTPGVNDGGFTERGTAMYYLAVANRGLGLRELEQAVQKPNEAPQRKDAANKRFAEAQRWFSTARDWYAGQKNEDWSGRARADQAEMEIRTGRVKEARATTEPFTKDPAFAKNKYRMLGLYYHGLACFLDRDIPNAGRSLNQLDFKDPSYSIHARYLVGRILHLSGEAAEASVNYELVLNDYEKAKKDAAAALPQPDRFKNNPFEKNRLTTLAQGAPPEAVAGATFHSACLAYEAGKIPAALEKFTAFIKTYPTDLLAPDARLRVVFCLVQLKQYDEAVKSVVALPKTPDETVRLADQIAFWLGKAQLGVALQADPNNVADRTAKFKTALDTIRLAAEQAGKIAATDPDAKTRRHEMLFELAEGYLVAKQSKEAVATLETLWNEQALPTRREELMQRLIAGYGAVGNIAACEDRCNEFRRLYPQSVITPAINFRLAENSYIRAVDAAKAKAADSKLKFEEAASKFKDFIEKNPEFERVNHARYALGICQVQLGSLDDAVKTLGTIPAPDRTGDLAGSAFLLADCLIRQAPVKAEDALQENQIREKLTEAAALLDGFASGNPKATETPAALLKLGFCQKRLGSTLADANERNQVLAKARESFERLERDFPKDPLAAQGTIEKAKVKSLVGDRGGAMNDLRSVLNNAAAGPIAPLAAVNLANLFREQNQPAEAVKVLEEARKKYEPDLAKDPERADWIQLMRYHQGVATFETGKPVEARVLFEQIIKDVPAKPVALEAALRSGQCRIAEAKKLIVDGTNARNQAGNDMNRKTAALQMLAQGKAAMTEAAETLLARAEQFKATMPVAESRARICYDAAWAFRELAADEIATVKETLQKEAHQKLIDAAKAKLPANSPPPNIPMPEVDRTKLPLQKSEQRSFDAYKKLIDEFTDSALSVDARFELAELRADRADFEEAIRLLKDALDKEPSDRPVSPETIEKIRLRLGASLYSKGDFAAAATQFETVAGNPKSPYFADASYRAGEALFSAGEFAKAVTVLTPFRDKPEFHNVAGISDRALLRLGQSLVSAKNPDGGRQTFEVLLQRFGNGNPFAADARFGIGSAFAAQGKHDDAIKNFEQVIAATTSELAAKAQLQIGLCRLALGKHAEAAAAFLVIPSTYDYPVIGLVARLEAARAFEEGKMSDQAVKLLEKLIADTPPDSDIRKAAMERLAKLKK